MPLITLFSYFRIAIIFAADYFRCCRHAIIFRRLAIIIFDAIFADATRHARRAGAADAAMMPLLSRHIDCCHADARRLLPDCHAAFPMIFAMPLTPLLRCR